MGRMINPDNVAFQDEINSWIYVDKTGLIEFTNSVCDTADKFVCNSRPRRFGKSYAADMLTAYYSKGCESRSLFNRFEISRERDYGKYLNNCDVIRFDVQWCMLSAKACGSDLVDFLNQSIVEEMRSEHKDCDFRSVSSAFMAMNLVNTQTGIKFVVIIDEWEPRFVIIRTMKSCRMIISISCGKCSGGILIVGINYDKKSKKHACRIEDA